MNELYATKLRLQTIMRQKTKGAILRSKARWHEQGERNTRYFLNLEKRNNSKKTVTRLKLSDNKLTSDPVEILQEQKTFFQTLYKSHNTNQHNLSEIGFFSSANTCLLNENDKMLCEGKISEEEWFAALKEFKNNKTPGTDGFSVEFYKSFWPELGTDMTVRFNHAFRTGSLSISQKRGIISLIPKKNKDKTLLENLRPISLLNIDYKILTKAIAKRLETVLPKIINPDQTGSVNQRTLYRRKCQVNSRYNVSF